MANRASTFLKQLFSAVSAMLKVKTLAVKSKTRGFKVRLVILRLLRSKKILLKAINHKMHALLMSQEPSRECGSGCQEHHSRPIVLYSAARDGTPASATETEPTAADEDYPDPTHSLLELEDEDADGYGLGNVTGSVIDLVRNSREEFSLEDEIDRVADVVIKRFHRRMRLQTQESFKRHQEMVEKRE